MKDSLKLTAEKTYEAKLKFLIICNYISTLHHPDEKLDNWYAGITSLTDSDKKSGSIDLFTMYKRTYVEMDESTWKEFRVNDSEVASEVARMLRDNGFDTEEPKVKGNQADVIYVFRKKK
jgi:hypothetical protein